MPLDVLKQAAEQIKTMEVLGSPPDDRQIQGISQTPPQVETIVNMFDGSLQPPSIPTTVAGLNLSAQAFYKLAREIRNDPTVRLVRELVMAPILKAGWSYEGNINAPDGAVDFIKSKMDPMRRNLLRTSMECCMDFGWCPYEVIIDEMWNLKVKPLLVDMTTILVNAADGSYMGLRQAPQFTFGGSFVYLNTAESFVVAQDVEAGNYYGRATLRSLIDPYNETQAINKSSRRYDAKVAGTHWVIYYPLGKSRYNGVEMDNGEIAKQLLAKAESVGGIIVPRSVLQAIDTVTAQAANNEAAQWKIELVSDKGSGQVAFENKLKYLDVLKVRAFGVPERSILEGQYGTKAEAEAHADIAMSNLDVKHEALCSIYNTELVNKYLRYHYGREYEGTVWILPAAMNENMVVFMRRLYLQLMTDPNILAQEYPNIDMNAVREGLDIPEAVTSEVETTVPEEEDELFSMLGI